MEREKLEKLKRAETLVLGKTEDKPSFMSTESTILEPIVCTQSFVRFQLEPKGILSKNTAIQFRVETDVTSDDKMALNISTGISALIKTATLKIGGRVINSIQDVPFYHAMTKAYNSPGYRAGIDNHLHGIHNVMTQVSSVAAGAGTFTLRDIDPLTPTSGSFPYTSRLRSPGNGGPRYAMFLRELCPVLNDIELPLFLLEKAGDITFELQLNTQTSTTVGLANGVGGDVASGGNGTIAFGIPNAAGRDRSTALTLDVDSVKMFIDRHYYDEDTMMERAESLNSSKGMSLRYVDVVTTTAAINSTTPVPAAGVTQTQTLTNQIAVSGMRVQNIKWCYTVADYTSNAVSLVPRYSQDFTGRNTMKSTMQDDTWNIRVNDMLYYNTDVQNPAFKCSELESIYASPVALFTGLYSMNAMTEKSGAFPVKTSLFPTTAEYSLDDLDQQQLAGSHHFAGANLSVAYGNASDDSVLIGQKPIEVIHKFPITRSTNYNYVVRYFTEVVKSMALKDGLVEVFT